MTLYQTLVLKYDNFHITKLSPQPELKPKWGLRLALWSLYPATPTHESIIQKQINLDVKRKVVGHNVQTLEEPSDLNPIGYGGHLTLF